MPSGMTIPEMQSRNWQPSNDQHAAISFLLGQAACALFADPGVGKTSTSLAAFKILKQQGIAKKMLVVAPLHPATNSWPGEIAKWAEFHDLTYSIIHGGVAAKERALEQDVDIYIINYEGLLWLFPDPSPKAAPSERHSRHLRWDWDVLCCDEGTKLKSTQTKRFKRLRSYFGTFKRRWLLTGTPVPNGYQDLFGQIFVLDGGAALGKYITHFRNQYMVKSFNGFSYDLRPGAEKEIEQAIAPYVLRIAKATDTKQVPMYHDVYLPEDVRIQYRELEREFYLQLEQGEVVASNAAVVGGKLRQFANGAIYTTDDMDERYWLPVHEYKLEALKSVISELNGEPVLVFYEFQSDLERISSEIPHAKSLSTGSVAQTQQTIKDFNAGRIPVLLAHPASAAHGLNLQEACKRVLWFSMTWNLEYYLQGNARVDRQGQISPHVYIHYIRCIGTKDEQVAERINQKDMTQQKLLQALAKD